MAITQDECINMIMGRTPEPSVQILEQPRARGLRFRYECEGRAAGSIPGENSTPENRTFPKIMIKHSNNSDAIVVVSCVSKDNPPRPHPHSLVGKDCKKGVCTVKLKKQSIATFPNLGIQCAKKKEVSNALQDRKQLRVDPFQTGFDFDVASYDLSTVRLCFQVFLPDELGKFTRIVNPEVSQCIFDKKTVTDLVICRISLNAGSVRGGDEVFLLCDKVNKEDIEVRFFEETEDGVIWEARGDFGQQDVHRQFAIVFKTPCYRDQAITKPRTVKLQLRRSSDGVTSDAIDFTYKPVERDQYHLESKRVKRLLIPDQYATNMDLDSSDLPSQGAGGSKKAKEAIKNRLLAKPRRSSPSAVATVVKEEGAEQKSSCGLAGGLNIPNSTATNAIPMQLIFEQDTNGSAMAVDMGKADVNPAGSVCGIGGEAMGYNWPQDGVQQFIADNGLQPLTEVTAPMSSAGIAAVTSTSQQQQQQHLVNGGDQPDAHSILSDLAEGRSTSLTLDSGSLLQYLQDDGDGQILSAFLSNPEPDMQP